jgi:hypothetical protein
MPQCIPSTTIKIKLKKKEAEEISKLFLWEN